MPYQNISASLSDADLNAIKQKCSEVEGLMPFLINLTPKERQQGFKLGKKAEKFYYDILKIAHLSPHLVPLYIDMAEFNTDFNLYMNLSVVELKLRQLTEAVNDTRMAIARECAGPALAIYQNIKSASQGQVPGADSTLKDLKPYFKKERKRKV